MDVEVAGDPGQARHVDGVVFVSLEAVPGGKHVVEAIELIVRREQTACRASSLTREPHAAGEGALEHCEAAVGLEPEQEQLARLVGGERERAARRGRARLSKPREQVNAKRSSGGVSVIEQGVSGMRCRSGFRAVEEGTIREPAAYVSGCGKGSEPMPRRHIFDIGQSYLNSAF